mmetsp:Transcript_76756/g.133049  ORF Transcript_76756/g.133049 Transcript_76756/m.133049 type:complete len:601 (+) Transcript_76756:41-1843(+)
MKAYGWRVFRPILLLFVTAPATRSGTSPSGHVFILRTDIRYLACDAWLLPVSDSMHVDEKWGVKEKDLPERPTGWGTEVRLLQTADNSDSEVRKHLYAHPQPWLAHVIDTGLSIEELLAPLRQFLTEASAQLNGSRFGRAMPLLAVPMFGAALATRSIDGSLRTGENLEGMLAELRAFTATHAIDVALCTLDDAAFSAALDCRRRADATFFAKDTSFHNEVERLARLFLDGRVSLFLGAGVSINAGLPSWQQLLDLIAAELDYPPQHREALTHLNPLEAATVLEAAAGGEAALKAITAKIIGAAKRHSLQHALLAGLPFKGCVTTNYDDLFERAVRFNGDDLAVLPAEIGEVVDRWLLKLHGDVNNPPSIVLTRADYTRFSTLYSANEGVLQGLLLTQHVLFCGFSMRDENWCRLVDAVRSPLTRGNDIRDNGQASSGDSVNNGGTGSLRLGTVLSLQQDELFDSLWDGLLQVTPFDKIGVPPPEGVEGGAALAWHARSLEIFLDHVASVVEVERCCILLNPKYASIMSPCSTKLAAHIRTFLANLDDDSKNSRPFKQLVKLLLEMGLRTEEAKRLVDDPNIEGPYRRRLHKLQEDMPSH